MKTHNQIRSVAIMKKSVRVLFSTALMLILMMSVAAAKPKDWVDPQYSFNGIHRVVIEDMDLNKLVDNDIDGRNLQAVFQSEADKRLEHAHVVKQAEIADARITVRFRCMMSAAGSYRLIMKRGIVRSEQP